VRAVKDAMSRDVLRGFDEAGITVASATLVVDLRSSGPLRDAGVA
jgi:hypothetical protein